MNPKNSRSALLVHLLRSLVALACTLVLVPGDLSLLAAPMPIPQATEAAAKIPADQLDSLVAPIALYPDPMLSQTLVAST